MFRQNSGTPNVIFLAKVMSNFSVFSDRLTNLLLINFIANMSSTRKHFDETEWSQEVEEEASLIQPSGIYWDYIMSQGSQPEIGRAHV